MLSDDRIAEMMRDTWGCASIVPRHAEAFARAIEAAARRDALEEAEKKCELVAQRWSHHMVAPSAALGCAAAIRTLKETTQ